jgi:cytochrome P450
MRAITTTELFGGTMMSPVPDPYPVYRKLRAEQPVVRLEMPWTGAPYYLITRYDDVLAVLKDAALYSSRANAKGIGLVMGRTILEMDGKEHRRHRNIIAPAFAPRALRGAVPEVVAAIAHDLIDGFQRDGRADLVSQFTFTFPLRVIANIIGVPIEDYDEFHRRGLEVISFADHPAKAFAAAQAIADYVRPILERRKIEPTGDLLSTLVHAEVDGERLTDEELVSFLRLLLPAGAETTYRLIGNALFALLTHPGQLEEVRAERATLDLVIEEALRWESPVQYVSRETTAAAAIGGVELPAGAMVVAALGSANRDERRYEDPDRFDMHRASDEHLAFGFGAHFCAGSHLARLEARIALDALLERLPNLHLDPAGESRVVGLAFRSPNRLPVRFDVAGPRRPQGARKVSGE